ncbi:hypothetical protein OPV22_008113 [Ensete ventricosum]|uniref:Uncharacterized protein n=1 Tax=Ensete ventricosum TaxID=4639 RepID=A0AAV8RF84_ENSVE|nr:hypothetical protein OPV22_008113 [Ensete ventricosum]
MESIGCPSPSLPPHSFLSHHSAKPRRRRSAQLLLLLTKSPKHRNNLLFLAVSPTQQQALSNSLNAAATSPAAGGDLSVLVPISALLLSIYWVANFIVPGMITKELQPATSEQEAGTEEEEEEGTVKPSNLKIKKSRGMKKTTTPL